MNKIILKLVIIFLFISIGSRVFSFTPVIGFIKSNLVTFSSIGNQVAGPAPTYLTGKHFNYSNVDGSFNSPNKTALDSTSDFLYVADRGNNRIVKLKASTGAFIGAIGSVSSVISGGTCTVGTTSGWCTGGTFGVSSAIGGFNGPKGIAVDHASDLLYVSDSYSRIIKIQASTGQSLAVIGNISTTGTAVNCTAIGPAPGWCTNGVASGSGAGYGQFNSPEALSLDTTNQVLYIADTGNARIVKVTISSGATSGTIGNLTSAGTSLNCSVIGPSLGWCTGGGTYGTSSADGGFNTPIDLAVDTKNGFLYIVDTGAYNSNNHRIVKVNLSSGLFAGKIGYISAAATFPGTCTSTGVTSVWCSGGTTIASSAEGGFYNPTGITLDSANDILYVTDGWNYRITKIIAGTNSATSGNTIGSVGYVVSSAGTCPNASITSSWCTGGQFASGTQDGMFNYPFSISVDSSAGSGALYISDSNNNRIVKLNLSGLFIGAVGETVTPASAWTTGATYNSGAIDNTFNYPKASTFDSVHNFLFVVDSNNNRIMKINASTGAFIGAIGSVKNAGGTCLQGVTTGWCQGGEFSASALGGAFYSPSGITYDSTSNLLYVADSGNNRISKINADTGAYIGSIGFSSVSSGTCGTGVATNWCNGSNFSLSAADGGFNNPLAIVIDPSGSNLYVSDANNYRIVKISANNGSFAGAIGYVTNSVCGGPNKATNGWCSGGGVFGASTVDGAFNMPEGLAIDSTNSNLYIADTLNNRISKIGINGSFVGAIGNTTASTGTCPSSGAATNWCSGGTFVFSSTNGGFYNPKQIAIDTIKNFLYVADFNNSRIVKININNGVSIGSLGRNGSSISPCTVIGSVNSWCPGANFSSGLVDGNFYLPYGVSVDSTNNVLFISEYGSSSNSFGGNRIQKISPKK